jgi:hypothetical protein
MLLRAGEDSADAFYVARILDPHSTAELATATIRHFLNSFLYQLISIECGKRDVAGRKKSPRSPP